MHLCDFGADIDSCPEGRNCQGPGGTTFTFPRLYSFDQWIMRSWVRDTLRGSFPEKREEIDRLADPGEYGLESYSCRLICCFIFMMSVVDDLRGTLGMVVLVFASPTRPDMWIKYEEPDWADKKYVKKVHGWSELDFVRFRVAGMPLHWKIINLVFVLIPKLFIWYTLCSTGFHFLMETSGIVDLIMNSVAMKFILDLDGMILDHLATEATKHVMAKIEPMTLFDTQEVEEETEENAIERYRDHELTSLQKMWPLLLPKRLITIIALMAVYVTKYYWANCIVGKDGSIFSKDLYAPKDSVLRNPLTLVFDWLFETSRTDDDGLIWSMPKEESL